MATANLTDRLLRSLTADEKRLEVWDEAIPGLHVRVSSRGSKVFYLRYRAGSRQRRMKLGPYPALQLADAREQAKAAIGDLSKGSDPQAKRRATRNALTFAELAEEYLERHAKRRKKSWREDERKLRRDVLPTWGSLKALDISRSDVLRLVEAIADRGAPVAANRTLALVSRVFNFAIDAEILQVNPAQRVRRPARERPRERVLTEAEIAALWEALDEEHPVVAATFRVRLLTAQRGVEILKMRREHVAGEWWTIPAELSKNGLPHRVFLSPQVREILDGLEPFRDRAGWMFPSPKKQGSPVSALRKATRRVCERAGFDFTPHDLRRTAASLMAGMGTPRLVVAKILNHVERGVTATYERHSYDPEKKRALLAWGRRVEALASGQSETNVIPFGA